MSAEDNLNDKNIIKRGKNKAVRYDLPLSTSCLRYCVVNEPHYYTRIVSVPEDDLFLYPLECGITTCTPDYYIANNILDFELVYIEFGSMILKTSSGTYEIHSGECYLIDTTHPYIYYCNCPENHTLYFLHFGGKHAREYYQYIIERNNGPIFAPGLDFIDFFRQTIIHISSAAILDPFETSSRITALLSKLFDTLSSDGSDSLSTVVDYIKEHYPEPISINTLCEISSFSKSHLIKRFKSSFGCTPYQYILDVRLTAANRRLHSGDISINELAYAVGFNSSVSFIRAFKRKYNISPGSLRLSSKDLLL